MRGEGANGAPLLDEPPIQLVGEQEIGTLGLRVRPPRAVAAALPVEVVEIDVPDRGDPRRDRDHAIGDAREQRQRERDVAEVIRADLRLEAVDACARTARP